MLQFDLSGSFSYHIVGTYLIAYFKQNPAYFCLKMKLLLPECWTYIRLQTLNRQRRRHIVYTTIEFIGDEGRGEAAFYVTQ